MATALIFLWLAAFPLMGSPGPATLSLAGLGAAYGMRRGIPYLIGIIIGTFTVLLMIASGVTARIIAEPALGQILVVLAATYILYLAWKIATAPVITTPKADARVPSLPGGFLLAIANPKAFAAIGAVYSGHALPIGSVAGGAAVKVAALTAVIIIVNTVWLAAGSALSRVLGDPKLGRAANIAFAVMLILSVAAALLGG